MRVVTLSLSSAAGPREDSSPRVSVRGAIRVLLGIGGGAAAAAVVALLTAVAGTWGVLVAISAALALATMVARPHWAMMLVAFLVYLNVPVLISRQGVPKVAASSIVLLLALPVARHMLVHRRGFRVDRVMQLMGLLLAVLAIGSIGARSVPLALDYIQTYVLEGLLLYVLVVNAVRSLADVRRLVAALLAAGALLGLLTTYQEVAGDFRQQFGGLVQRNYEYLALREQAEYDPELKEALRDAPIGNRSRRPGGPVSEPNRFAQILIVLLPFAVWMWRTSRSAAGRAGAAVAGVLILAAIVFSDSRGAFVSVLGLMAVAIRLGWLRWRNVALAGLALALVVPVVAPRYVERILSLGTVIGVGTERPIEEADGAVRGRLTEMFASGLAFLDHPLIGVGPGQYAQMYSVEYHFRSEVFRFRDLPAPRRAHSLYLELAAETGVLGLGAFFGIVAYLMYTLWRLRAATLAWAPDWSDLMTAALLALVAYFATAIFLHLSYIRYYWLLVALCGAACHAVSALIPRPAPGGAAAAGTLSLPGGHRWLLWR